MCGNLIRMRPGNDTFCPYKTSSDYSSPSLTVTPPTSLLSPATPLPLMPLDTVPWRPLALLCLTLCEQIGVPNPDTELEVIFCLR